jgi:hypothetical protein
LKKKLYQAWDAMDIQRIRSDEKRRQTAMIIDPAFFFVRREISGT